MRAVWAKLYPTAIRGFPPNRACVGQNGRLGPIVGGSRANSLPQSACKKGRRACLSAAPIECLAVERKSSVAWGLDAINEGFHRGDLFSHRLQLGAQSRERAVVILDLQLRLIQALCVNEGFDVTAHGLLSHIGQSLGVPIRRGHAIRVVEVENDPGRGAVLGVYKTNVPIAPGFSLPMSGSRSWARFSPASPAPSNTARPTRTRSGSPSATTSHSSPRASIS